MNTEASNYGNAHERVGNAVTYVDEHGTPFVALVTAVWGNGPEALGQSAINVVYVSGNMAEHDPYGRQITRATSVSAKREDVPEATAHGRYYVPYD